MNRLMREDPRRRFVIGFTIEDVSMRFWYCSRSDVLVSEEFNWQEVGGVDTIHVQKFPVVECVHIGPRHFDRLHYPRFLCRGARSWLGPNYHPAFASGRQAPSVRYSRAGPRHKGGKNFQDEETNIQHRH